VAEAIPKLAEWKAVARPGARREIEDGVMTRFEKDLRMLQQQDTTEESVLSMARELDQLMVQASKHCWLDRNQADKARMQKLRASARALCDMLAKEGKEHRILAALGTYVQSPTLENMSAIRAAYANAAQLRFGTDVQAKLFQEALGRIKADLVAAVSAEDSGDDLRANDLRDTAQLALNLTRLVTEDEAVAEYRKFFDCFVAHMSVLSAHGRLLQLGPSAAEQVAHDDALDRTQGLQVAWQAAVIEAGALPAEEDDEQEDKGEAVSREVQGITGCHMRKAKVALDEMLAALRTAWEEELQTKLNDLLDVAGGQRGGTSWKNDVQQDGDWTKVSGHASRTLLSRAQKGVARTIANGKAGLDAALARVRLENDAVHSPLDLTPWEARFKDAVNVADITAAEALLVKALRDADMTGPLPRQAVQRELDRLLGTQLTADDIQPAIWVEAQRALL
jgi:hypothetical protein